MDNRDIKHTCTFTGHRPERLELTEEQVIGWLAKQIKRAVDDGYTDLSAECSAASICGLPRRF